MPHSLLGLAPPNEPAEAAATVAAHHDEHPFAQLADLLVEQVPGVGLVAHHDGVLDGHLRGVCRQRAVLRPEIDRFGVTRIADDPPVLGDDGGGATTWKTTSLAPRVWANAQATRKASFDGSPKSVGWMSVWNMAKSSFISRAKSRR
jgi:hypothetical protein